MKSNIIRIKIRRTITRILSELIVIRENELHISRFRQIVKILPFFPYENFGSISMVDNIGHAREILKNGWGLPNYPKVILQQQTIPWEESVNDSRTISFNLHSWRIFDELLMAYSQTRNVDFLEPAVHVALDWISKFSNISVDSSFAWYDMAVGMRAYRLAFILEAASRLNRFSHKQISLLLKSLLQHKRYLLIDKNIAYQSNHGFFQLAGLLALANRFMFIEGMDDVLRIASKRFEKIMDRQFSKEGIHLEHSPEYFRKIYISLRGIYDSGIPLSKLIELKIRTMDENLNWFIKPDGTMVNFGDSEATQMIGQNASVDQWLFPEMQFITGDGLKENVPFEWIRTFKETGYFIVRNNWPKKSIDLEMSYLAQIASFYSRTHKHADDLSFIWFDKGADILIDPGLYGYIGKTEIGSQLWKDGYYYDDPKRMYIESTRAHNTVEIDGRDYLRKGRKPYRSAIVSSGDSNGIAYCETRVWHFHSIRHRRLLIFKPANWLVVIDWLWDRNIQLHDYAQWFHFSPHLNVTREENKFLINRVDGKFSLSAIPLVPSMEMSDVYEGATTPIFQGWWSPTNRELKPNPTVSFEYKQTSNVAIGTLFTFSKEATLDPKNTRIDPITRKGNISWFEGKTKKIIFAIREGHSPEFKYQE